MSRSKPNWVIGLFSVALLGVTGALFLRPSSPVPVGASRVPWTQGSFNLSSPWRSGHEVFVYSASASDLVDINTGAKTSVAHFGNYGHIYTGGIRFSPDGKWLLWATGTDASPIYMATQVPTGRCVQRPRAIQSVGNEGPDFAWLPDGKRWVENFTEHGQTYTHVFSVDTPRVEKMPQRSSPALDAPTLPIPSGFSQSFSSAQPVNRVVSPDGSKIAWFDIADDNSINFSYFIGSFIRLGRIPHAQIQRHRVGLWVSRRDGRNARQVIPDFICETQPVFLQWAPDGRHLSFNYALDGPDGLWTVPVSD